MAAAQALIDKLFPVEILLAIFKLVDEKDRCHLCLVNKRWYNVLYHSPELWKRLDLSNRCTLGGDKFIELADHDRNTNKRLSSLFSITPFSNESYSAATQCFPSFNRFSSITRLDLSCTGINLEFFSTSPIAHKLADTLTHLIVSGCPLVTSSSLVHLKTLRQLIYLDVSHCDNVDDLGLDVLAFFVPWIKELNLAYLFKLTEAGVRKLFRMSGLRALNLMGCCRIKSYPWAITNAIPTTVLPLRELSIGEDSRIQTRGFWLLWCTWQHWDMKKLSDICPFLETIRLNMVLFDMPANGLELLLDNCKSLKTLSLVIERNTIPTLCTVADQLRKLKSLDLTVHIGVQGEQVESLLAANVLPRLKALKFHSKHTNVFNDESLQALIKQASGIEYLELNGDDLNSSSLINVADKLSTTLQSLLLHHVKLSNNAMKAIAKKCKSLRDLTITDLQVDTQGLSAVRSSVVNNDRIIKASEREKSMNGLGAANKLKWLVSDASICLRLKKIELASYDGFCDRDLACIPAACPNLQWVDFHFSFTFPKTLISLVKHCPNLLYLRLFHSNPPLIFDASTPSTPTLSATSATQRPSTASSASSSQSPTRRGGSTASALSPTTRTSLLNARLSPSSRTSPFMASLYADSSSGTGRQSQSRKERKRGANATGRKVKACAADEESARVVEPKWVNVRVPLGSNALAAPVALKKKSKAVYPCSSAECQALIAFALGANAAGGKTERGAKEETIPALSRKLRVLDLSGNHGLSDYILSTSFADGLTNLHTLFLEGCDEGLSEVGIVKFAEKRWKSLKRMHLRNCRGVALNVYQENFLAKGLEIDVVVDGGRLRNLD